jgi:hypothetical protein
MELDGAGEGDCGGSSREGGARVDVVESFD